MTHPTEEPPAGAGGEKLPTGSVLGVPVAIATYERVVEEVRGMARAGDTARLVAAANTHVVALARHDGEFGRTLARFDLIVPDGMPLVWSLNRTLGSPRKLTDRVYGPTLMLRCFEAFQGDGQPGHFLLGGKQGTLNRLLANLRERFPQSRILGHYSPPFGAWPEGENERIVARIVASGATIVWIGLGCPKQEKWMAEMKDRLPPGVYFGIGAAFAFHAGEVRQAPRLLQGLGLEWAYRLAMEPRRLFGRYVKFNSLFLFYSMKDTMFPNQTEAGK